MSQSQIKTRDVGSTREIMLADPATLNALTGTMMAQLRAELAAVAASPAIRAVVLTGEGRGFSSGANLLDGAVSPKDANLKGTLEQIYHPTIMALRELEKPVICAVNGVAAGAGLSLALACDLRIAARSAKFIQVFVRIGAMPDAGSTWFLPRLIGPERARYMAMTGETVDAETAVLWGLALEVVDDAVLLEKAHALAAKLAAGPTLAIGAIKRALDASESNTLPEQLAYEAQRQQWLGQSADFNEGVKAFQEKRKAVFAGR